MPTPPMLELTDATVIRGGTRVLDRLSMTIQEGEHAAILGPNGAGKSSLLRLLMLDDYPLAGDNGAAPIRWFGRQRWDLAALRPLLGFVSGDLDATFAVHLRGGRVAGLEAVASGFFASQGIFSHHRTSDTMWERSRRALARIEAGHLESKPLTEMSAGEKRRVLIARALVNDPRVLLLDEPTTGLDLVARHHFMEAIRRLAGAATTIVLVTHHVDEIIPEIQRVFLLRDGRIAHDGPPPQVLTSARLSETFNAPLVVERIGEYYRVHLASAS